MEDLAAQSILVGITATSPLWGSYFLLSLSTCIVFVMAYKHARAANTFNNDSIDLGAAPQPAMPESATILDQPVVGNHGGIDIEVLPYIPYSSNIPEFPIIREIRITESPEVGSQISPHTVVEAFSHLFVTDAVTNHITNVSDFSFFMVYSALGLGFTCLAAG
jgi:hypothetical protein